MVKLTQHYQRSLGARSAGSKQSYDFHQTPTIATRALLDRWQPETRHIWEPACGHGAISKVLAEAGYRVTSTDIQQLDYGIGGVDFLQCRRALGGAIITNPPYNRANEFVAHALELVDQACFLLRLSWLEGLYRYENFYGPGRLAHVFVFPQRLPRMHRVGYDGPTTSSAMAFAWFIFDRRGVDSTTLDWLPFRDKLPSLFDSTTKPRRKV